MQVVAQTFNSLVRSAERYRCDFSSLELSLRERLVPASLIRPNQNPALKIVILLTAIAPLYLQAGEDTSADILVKTATVEYVKGYSIVFPQDDDSLAVFLERGDRIRMGDRLITGENGFIGLSFGNGSVVGIQPDSELIAELIDCGADVDECTIELDTVNGNIKSNVNSTGGKNTEFTIKTPYASAAVRGTIFDIDVDATRLIAGVTEGAVRIFTDSASVELPENFGTKVVENQPPSDIKPLLGEPGYIPGPNRYSVSDEIEWNPVADANGYVFSVTNDEGLVFHRKTELTEHQFSPQALGTHTMQVRAVDNDGFRGKVSERTFDFVETNDAVAGPEVNVTIEPAKITMWVDGDPERDIVSELQLSTTADFASTAAIDVPFDKSISSVQPENSIFVRARYVLSNTEVTRFGPVREITTSE